MKRFACVTCSQVFDGPAHFHGEAGPFCATHVLESLAKVEVSVALFPPAGSEQAPKTPLNRTEMPQDATLSAPATPANPKEAPKPKKRGWFK